MIRESLAKSLDGDVLVAGDPAYNTARAVWNAMVDRRPRVIARCHTVADGQRAVRAGMSRSVTKLQDGVLELSSRDLPRIDDTPQGRAVRRYWKGHYLRELS